MLLGVRNGGWSIKTGIDFGSSKEMFTTAWAAIPDRTFVLGYWSYGGYGDIMVFGYSRFRNAYGAFGYIQYSDNLQSDFIGELVRIDALGLHWGSNFQ